MLCSFWFNVMCIRLESSFISFHFVRKMGKRCSDLRHSKTFENCLNACVSEGHLIFTKLPVTQVLIYKTLPTYQNCWFFHSRPCPRYPALPEPAEPVATGPASTPARAPARRHQPPAPALPWHLSGKRRTTPPPKFILSSTFNWQHSCQFNCMQTVTYNCTAARKRWPFQSACCSHIILYRRSNKDPIKQNINTSQQLHRMVTRQG